MFSIQIYAIYVKNQNHPPDFLYCWCYKWIHEYISQWSGL